MIQYKKSILLLLTAFWITSCTQNELPMEGRDTGPLTFKLCLSGNSESVTRVVAPPFYENLNIPVYLYIYKVGEATPFTLMKGKIEDGEDVIFTYWPDNDAMRNDSYDIYAVGYDGKSMGIVLDEKTKKTDLLNLIQTTADINVDGKMYMLSGALKSANFHNADKTIPLTRNVCRFSFDITDNTPGKVLKKIVVSFESLNQTYVFNSDARGDSDIPLDAVSIKYSKEIVPVEHVFNDSIYFFEKKPTVDGGVLDGDRVLVTIKAFRPDPDDKTKDEILTYQFYLNADEGYITRRNTIYMVKAALSLTEISLSLNTPINWDDQVTDEEQTVYPDKP